MKRFHVHVAVDQLEPSLRFYQALFGVKPTVRKNDYAKWMLDDPSVNFAISVGESATGVSHLGLQVDDDQALDQMAARLQSAGLEGKPETRRKLLLRPFQQVLGDRSHRRAVGELSYARGDRGIRRGENT
jgi:catechol 2,3-dioxygenase-like lactoylglutathione lyase family enzyme